MAMICDPDELDDHINVFIDFETFWGTKYSLRSPQLSYTDYICDDRFQIHGMSVVTDNSRKAFFLVGDEVRAYFTLMKSLQADGKKIRMVAHNMLFDGLIAKIKFGFEADEYFCTLAMIDAMYQHGMSSSLDECMKVLLGRTSGKDDILNDTKNMRTEDILPELWDRLVIYALDDVKACKELYDKYAKYLPAIEHETMSNILKMACRPRIVFNERVIQEAVKEAEQEREDEIRAALSYGATEEILRGNKVFPTFLKELGYKVPMKHNAKGKKIPALAKTDQGFIDMLESRDERLQALAKGRLAVKSTQATTRAYRLQKLHNELGYFPATYNYARAHTWRVTGANKINPANFKRGSKLRTCLEAPLGYVLGVADASQIECRCTGYLAGQDDLLQLFRDKKDPYNEMASEIFGRRIDRKNNPDDFLEGFIGKTATLGLGFYMGGAKFHAQVIRDAKQYLGIDLDYDINEAYRVVNVYRTKNYKIVQFWEHCDRFLSAMCTGENITWKVPSDKKVSQLRVLGKEKKIFFPNGTWLYYPGLSQDADGQFTYVNRQGESYVKKYIYGGLLCENIVQKFARDITSYHLVKIAERYPVVLHTYDENVAMIPEQEAEEGVQWMLDVMSKPPYWAESIPLATEGGWAKEYSK